MHPLLSSVACAAAAALFTATAVPARAAGAPSITHWSFESLLSCDSVAELSCVPALSGSFDLLQTPRGLSVQHLTLRDVSVGSFTFPAPFGTPGGPAAASRLEITPTRLMATYQGEIRPLDNNERDLALLELRFTQPLDTPGATAIGIAGGSAMLYRSRYESAYGVIPARGVVTAAAVVPEPASWALLLGGGALLGLRLRRRR